MEKKLKVTLLGAGGGIGQSLSLLLRLDERISELALYDIQNAKGLAVDLSHIPQNQLIKGYEPKDRNCTDELRLALNNSDVIIIAAGIPRKPNMTRNDLFKVNASIIKSLIHEIGTTCPTAFLCIVSNPVNSLVPVAVEQLIKMNVYNPKKVFGVSTLDNLRLEQFLSLSTSIDSKKLRNCVFTIGGHSGETMVPIFAKWKGELFDESDYRKIIQRVRYGGDEVVKAKNGKGSATLSTALATNRFVSNLIGAILYGDEVKDVAYVNTGRLTCFSANNKLPELDYFALPIVVDNNGIKSVQFPENLTQEEVKMLNDVIVKLQEDVAQGLKFIYPSKL